MNETITTSFSVIFHLRIEREKHDLLPIYARITINGKRIELSSKQMMNPNHWNEKRGIAKPINDDYRRLNNYLEQLKSSYVACYREMSLQKKMITTETFKREYFGTNEDEYTLCKLMNYHNIDMKESISWGTMKNYFTTQKYLERFLKEKKQAVDIGLNEINYKFVTDFEYYLKTYKPKNHQKRLGNNGVMKHMERFRKMINVALKMSGWKEIRLKPIS